MRTPDSRPRIETSRKRAADAAEDRKGVVWGLIYVGDQIDRLVTELQNARMARTK
jgi:hypothetical protein